jgi:hypothetical protein
MAGPNPPGFMQADFEAGIRLAMQLGTPVDPARRPVFILPVATDSNEDGHGLPWDINGDMTETNPTVSNVLCAVEFKPAGSILTDAGGVYAQRATIIVTLLHAEWLLVRTAVAVKTSGDIYNRWHDAPDLALGTAGVYQLYFTAGDIL